MEEALPKMKKTNKGGLRTIPFIISNEIFEKVATFGLHANMILYLTERYHMTAATGTVVLYFWNALSNFLPIFGAILSDSFLGRFRVIALGSVVSLVGMCMLCLTAILPADRRTEACAARRSDCELVPWQLPLLFASFLLMSVGSGGIRPCALAFGADQLDRRDNSARNVRTLQTFFNWYYTVLGLSIVIASTVVVYIQQSKGWVIGFAVPVVLMLTALTLLLVGSPFYLKADGDRRVLVGLVQGLVASYRRRNDPLPPDTADASGFHNRVGYKPRTPSNRLRWLNRACALGNNKNISNPDEKEVINPWTMCTVQQVEDVKAAVRVLPIWSTGIMPGVIIRQQMFPVLQAKAMDRRVGSLEIPAASFGVFAILTLTVWVAVYDRALVRPLSRLTGHARGVTLPDVHRPCALRRGHGRGRARRDAALRGDTARMSAMRLVPQHCITGLAEALNLIGQIEFYYSEFPKSMSSIGVSLLALGMSFGSVAGSAIVGAINAGTRRGGRDSWLSSDLNRGHYEYYYLVLAVLCVANLVYFVWCGWAYGEEGQNRVTAEEVVEDIKTKEEQGIRDKKMEVQEGDVRRCEDSKAKRKGGFVALPFIIAFHFYCAMEDSLVVEADAQGCAKAKGGFKALPFIISNEILEKVAGFGLNINFITYLNLQYHLSHASAGSLLFAWGAVSNFAPIPGAVIADMYLGRFMVVAIGSIACLIGMVFLWLSAMIPGARPPPCDMRISPELCTPPGARNMAWLLAGFVFLSIGAGGVRPCSMAFGADQFSRHPKERRSRILQAYFNAYYGSIGVAFMVAVTVLVYVQDNLGWKVGLAVPTGLMLLSVASFLLGSGLYIKDKGSKQMFAGIGAAVVAAVRNRGAWLPEKTEDGVYHHLKDCKLTVPTDRLRFLNKACMISNTKEEKPGNGVAEGISDRGRRLCTVDQVEQLKSAIRVMPIWSSTIFLAQAMTQYFAVPQADAMDRRVGAGVFRVPSGTFAVFNMLTMSLWSGCYDRWTAPALRRLTGNPRGLTMKQRIGGGLLFGTAAMAAAAVVEAARRRQALAGGNAMSAFWLVPQYALAGLAEAFGVIGVIEFFYTELPKSMASFSMALLYMALGAGSLVGSLIIKVVHEASGRGGRTSWLAEDLNAGRYDYYYWLLAGFGAVNFVYFLWCGWAYGEEGQNAEWEDESEGETPMA
uniref:Uncharacterized protein n=1 Tax=Leersia perrieri TaxID=77586 RepID=A0A0D9V5Z3_9ORYZ